MNTSNTQFFSWQITRRTNLPNKVSLMFGKNGTNFLSQICTQVSTGTIHIRIPYFKLESSNRNVLATLRTLFSVSPVNPPQPSTFLCALFRPLTAYLGIKDQGPLPGFPDGCIIWLGSLLGYKVLQYRILRSPRSSWWSSKHLFAFLKPSTAYFSVQTQMDELNACDIFWL